MSEGQQTHRFPVFQLPKAVHRLDPPRIAPIACLVKEDPAEGLATKARAIGAATAAAERNIASREDVILRQAS